MRPSLLDPLFASLASVPGIGPARQKALQRLCGEDTIWALLRHLPTSLIDRRYMPTLSDACEGQMVTLQVRVGAHYPPPNRGKARNLPYRVQCILLHQPHVLGLTLTFFHARPNYLTRVLPEGQERLVSGRIERYEGTWQMVHPDRIVSPEKAESLLGIEPRYPLARQVNHALLHKAMAHILPQLPDLPEWIDPATCKEHHWPNWQSALQQTHQPESNAALEPDFPARKRLAYDELLAHQLALLVSRQHIETQPGHPILAQGSLWQQTQTSLPFSLTNAQHTSIKKIVDDMRQPSRMVRLLQGDVGSGKTVVALAALLHVIEAGYQGAFMAPTDLLARQHEAWIQDLIHRTAWQGDPPRIACLTGKLPASEKKTLQHALAQGEIDLIIGTHALFQQGVTFPHLGLIVVDEQHRFGVKQRLALTEKGTAAHILLMTATPIPRTLALTLYSDMQISVLDEKPPGRQKIDTRTIALSRILEVIDGLRRALKENRQIYWVCPRIDPPEEEEQHHANQDFKESGSAKERFATLKSVLPSHHIGLIHGQMPEKERDACMQDFRDGRCDILVATTVIEVGVDVPNATIMVIEQAERFGLAQLHQLRGRVGRGSVASTCLLLYSQNLSENGIARLHILRKSEDGFAIAEEDLRLRGSGNMLGTEQSGVASFRLARFPEHAPLVQSAHQEATALLAQDPTLASTRGKAVQILLHLFGYDQSIRYLRSG